MRVGMEKDGKLPKLDCETCLLTESTISRYYHYIESGKVNQAHYRIRNNFNLTRFIDDSAKPADHND
jgi:hypothetical protein